MYKYEWPARDYAAGASIQETISNQYLSRLTIQQDNRILDIGCGEGSYSTHILDLIPYGTLLGIDRSANMLALAKEKITDHPNFSVQKMDAHEINFQNEFDRVTSFWCLHWASDLTKVYTNIYQALKKGGKLLTLLPTGFDDPVIMSYKFLKASGEFPILNDFVPLVDFEKVAKIPEIMASIPFQKASVDIVKHSILLPSLNVFDKFIKGLAFFQGQVPDDKIDILNEAMTKAYDLHCKEHFQGKYWFNIAAYIVVAEK